MKILLRIIGILMFGYLVLALVLYFAGVHHVGFDDRYYRFLIDVNLKLGQWKEVEIPHIPVPDDYEGVAQWAVDFARGVLQFVNVLIDAINFVWNLLKFIAALLIVLFEDLPAIFSSSSSSSSSSEVSSSIPAMLFPII